MSQQRRNNQRNNNRPKGDGSVKAKFQLAEEPERDGMVMLLVTLTYADSRDNPAKFKNITEIMLDDITNINNLQPELKTDEAGAISIYVPKDEVSKNWFSLKIKVEKTHNKYQYLLLSVNLTKEKIDKHVHHTAITQVESGKYELLVFLKNHKTSKRMTGSVKFCASKRVQIGFGTIDRASRPIREKLVKITNSNGTTMRISVDPEDLPITLTLFASGTLTQDPVVVTIPKEEKKKNSATLPTARINKLLHEIYDNISVIGMSATFFGFYSSEILNAEDRDKIAKHINNMNDDELKDFLHIIMNKINNIAKKRYFTDMSII